MTAFSPQDFPERRFLLGLKVVRMHGMTSGYTVDGWIRYSTALHVRCQLIPGAKCRESQDIPLQEINPLIKFLPIDSPGRE